MNATTQHPPRHGAGAGKHVLRRNTGVWLVAGLTLLLNACASTAPVIKSVNPDRVTLHKAGRLTVTLKQPATKDTQLILSPGGPYLTQQVNAIGPVAHLAATANQVFAAGTDGNLRVIHFDHHGGSEVVAQRHFARGIDLVKVIGNTLYVGENHVGLHVFGIGMAGKLTAQGEFLMPETIRQIGAGDGGLFILSGHHTLRLIKPEDGKLKQIAITTLGYRINDFVVLGQTCYASGPALGLGIFDIHDADHITLTGHFTTSGNGEALVVRNQRAYVADGINGMTVLDVSDPTHIRWLGSHNKLGEVRAVTLDGKRAIVNNQGTRLVSLNIANDELPITGSFYKPAAGLRDFTQVGNIVYAATDRGVERIDYSREAKVQISNEGVNLGGSRRAFIKDNIAYVADWFSGLHIYDISIPNEPRQLGNYHTLGSSKGVYIKGHYAIVGDDDDGLQIIDVADPRHPVKVSGIASTGLAYTMKVVGNLVYLADHRGGFHIFDISDIRHPKHVAHYDTPGKSWAIDVSGHTAYVADDTTGLLVFDVSHLTKPRLIGKFDPKGYAEDVLIKDKVAFVSFFDKGFYILDIHDPTHPRQLAHLPIPGNARSIKIDGQYAYIAGWESGLQIVDISDLTQPKIVSYIDTSGSAWGANIYKGYAYVWDWWGGIKVIDVHDPLHPRFAGQYQARSRIERLARQGKFLFSANGSNGMQVFDINNPLNPIWATGVDFNGYARAIATTPTHAYVATDDEGIQVIDISNPFQSFWRSTFRTARAITRLRTSGNMLYAINASGELLSIDIGDGSQPSFVARAPLRATDLWAEKDDVFVASDGRQLLDFSIGKNKDNNEGRLQLRSRYQAPFTIMHVTASNNLIAISAADGRVQLLSRNGNRLAPISQFRFCHDITELRFDGARLLLFDPQRGLLTVELADPAHPRLSTVYPATGQHQGFVATQQAVFFSGESTIASVDLLPPIARHWDNDHTVSLSIPADMPLGPYHLSVRDANGQMTELGNAFSVALPRHNPHKFTMEEFKKIVRQQKANAPH